MQTRSNVAPALAARSARIANLIRGAVASSRAGDRGKALEAGSTHESTGEADEAGEFPDVGSQPLYVDLDGSLIASDSLWESLCLLMRRHPSRIAALPFWAVRGRAVLKSRIAALVAPEAGLLPYRAEVMALLGRERARGRPLVLATASHERIARAVAAEVGLFDDVLATTEGRNLKRGSKLEAIRDHSGGRPFAYLGDARADLPIWSAAECAYVVEPSPSLARAVARLGVPTEVVSDAQTVGGRRAFLGALRPHQWAKNGLLFAPIALAQQMGDTGRLGSVFWAFWAFCAVASAGYLFNDMLDIEADRRHPSKRHRPFASGRLSIPLGQVMIVALLTVGFGLALGWVSVAFTGMLGIYLMATLSYSLYLKERLLLDVLVLAGVYTHRILSGGVAADIRVSPWLLVFSVFFFMSLALVKRYVEVRSGVDTKDASHSISRRAYQASDVGLIETMGISSGYVSILVLGLWVNREGVSQYYSRPDALWLMLPLMLYWISRIWFRARRGELLDDPVLFALTDRVSYGIAVGIVLITLVAALGGVGG